MQDSKGKNNYRIILQQLTKLAGISLPDARALFHGFGANFSSEESIISAFELSQFVDLPFQNFQQTFRIKNDDILINSDKSLQWGNGLCSPTIGLYHRGLYSFIDRTCGKFFNHSIDLT